MNLEQLNTKALAEVTAYSNLQIAGQTLAAPYYINTTIIDIAEYLKTVGLSDESLNAFSSALKQGELRFAAHKGKGTPVQITSHADKLVTKLFGDPTIVSTQGLRDIMMINGLGVDCSGFVFNVMQAAYGTNSDDFLNLFAWLDETKSVFRAGTSLFTSSSTLIEDWNDCQPLDLIVIRDANKTPTHVALLIESNGQLHIAQSGLSTLPSGVTLTPFEITDGVPTLNVPISIGTSWQDLYTQGLLELRRLHHA